MLQLQAYLDRHGSEISVKGKTFIVEGISQDGDIAVGTFATKRSSYTGILCPNSTVVGHPGAEVWSVISGKGKDVATFAVHSGMIFPLLP